MAPGNIIYEHLKENNMLASCLGLRDGEEIAKKGITVFRKLFKGKAVCLWKSVVLDRDCGLGVPYLCEVGSKVVVNWNWLDNDWNDNNPAAVRATYFISLSILHWESFVL